MELVICMSLKDCMFFKKNLYFIKKNINPSHIYILTDKRNFRYLSGLSQNNNNNNIRNRLVLSTIIKVRLCPKQICKRRISCMGC